MMITVKNLKRNVGLFFIIVGCLFSSGYAVALVSGTTVQLFFLGLTFWGCWLIKAPSKYSFCRINKGGLFVVYLFLSLGIVISYFANMFENSFIDHILVLLSMFSALAIASRINMQQFRMIFVNGMVFFTIVTLIVWILIQMGIDIPSYAYDGLNGGEYRTIGLCTWMEADPRFMGPFWEPGLFASFLVLAIIFEICFNDSKPRIPAILICTIGVLLTASTAGYSLLFIVLFIWFRKNKRFGIIFDLLSILVVLLLYSNIDKLIMLLADYNPDVFGKLVSGGVSFDTRILSPLACLLVFFKSPIFGHGYSKAIELYNGFKLLFKIDSLTSTSGYMLAAFGICGIAYTIGIMWICFKQVKFPIVIRGLLFLILFFIVNKEPHYHNMLTYTIFCMMARNNEKMIIEEV